MGSHLISRIWQKLMFDVSICPNVMLAMLPPSQQWGLTAPGSCQPHPLYNVLIKVFPIFLSITNEHSFGQSIIHILNYPHNKNPPPSKPQNRKTLAPQHCAMSRIMEHDSSQYPYPNLHRQFRWRLLQLCSSLSNMPQISESWI